MINRQSPTASFKRTAYNRFKKAVKAVLPASVVEQLKHCLGYLSSLPTKVLGRSSILTNLYYGLPASPFAREHYGVMYGRMRYYQDLQKAQATQYLLRRNIHRLEKGLIMSPRREIFATGYIGETVECFVRSLKASCNVIGDGSELQWAYDVLSEYFKVTASHPLIDKARQKFQEATGSATIQRTCGTMLKPYKRDLAAPLSVSYEALLELSIRRRSVRWYLQKPVSRELIDKAIAVAALSPSACNRQPFEFRIFDDPELVAQVASIPGGTIGFSHNFPVIAVIIGKLRAYFSERDRHLIYIDGALAAMSFMYALETLGLSSCPINWPDEADKEKEMRKLLRLDPDERPIMLVSLGYPDPDKMVPYSAKKSLDQLRSYNKTLICQQDDSGAI